MQNQTATDSRKISNFWNIHRIGDEVRTPRFFNETLPFSRTVPYRLTKRAVIGNDDVPLHYASSLEIVLYENVTGEVISNNQRICIDENTVVVSPPLVVHGGTVKSDNGMIYCLQIGLDALSNYLRVDHCLEDCGKSLADAPVTFPEFDEMHALFEALILNDDNSFKRCSAMLLILETVVRHTPKAMNATEHISSSTEELKQLISWTHDHYKEHITLDDAANIVGFSKHYFCKWFKRHTGQNYIQYLKCVRIYASIKLLSLGYSVSEAGYACGYESIGYFIKCFKEIRGCTPKDYIKSVKTGFEAKDDGGE